MRESIYLSFVFFVTVLSLIVFPASSLTGISELFIGWMALIFLLFFVIGYFIIALKIIEKYLWRK